MPRRPPVQLGVGGPALSREEGTGTSPERIPQRDETEDREAGHDIRDTGHIYRAAEQNWSQPPEQAPAA